MPLRVEIVPVPSDPEDPHPWLADWIAVQAEHFAEITGHRDLTESLEGAATAYRWQDTTRSLRLLALDGPHVVGAAHVWMPLLEDRTLGYVLPARVPGTDERLVYDALWQTADPILRQHGRSVVHCWTTHPDVPHPGGDQRRVVPATGEGHLVEDGRARWLHRAGFALEQIERYSLLGIDGTSEARAAQIRREASGRAAGYRIRSWVGRTPPDLVDGMAELRSRMSVDVPHAGLDKEAEEWDPDRVRRRDERLAAAGRELVSSVAVTDSGRPVAYTDITSPRADPEVAFQDDTLVHGTHRGRRLGALVKACNLLTLQAQFPRVRRVHTWNAEENTHMLAINAELGFHTAGMQGGWQLRRSLAGSSPVRTPAGPGLP